MVSDDPQHALGALLAPNIHRRVECSAVAPTFPGTTTQALRALDLFETVGTH